jgi:hypothetical protein
MSKPGKLKPIALLLIGWLVAFAVLFPHGVVVCVGELAHVELGILGSACCDEDSHLAKDLFAVSAGLPDNTCTDGDHVLATSWHHHSIRELGKNFGRKVDVHSQPVRGFASTFDTLDRDVDSVPLPAGDAIPPLLLEHLSTLILIC